MDAGFVGGARGGVAEPAASQARSGGGEDAGTSKGGAGVGEDGDEGRGLHSFTF